MTFVVLPAASRTVIRSVSATVLRTRRFRCERVVKRSRKVLVPASSVVLGAVDATSVEPEKTRAVTVQPSLQPTRTPTPLASRARIRTEAVTLTETVGAAESTDAVPPLRVPG